MTPWLRGGMAPWYPGGALAGEQGRDPDPGNKRADSMPLAGSVPLLWSWIPVGSPGSAGEQRVSWGGGGGALRFGDAVAGCGRGGPAWVRRSPRRRCCRPR